MMNIEKHIRYLQINFIYYSTHRKKVNTTKSDYDYKDHNCFLQKMPEK